MKYKLSQSKLDQLAKQEFEHNESAYFMIDITGALEPITEPLPKPVIRNVEDLKALEGWEYACEGWYFWYDCNEPIHNFNKLKATLKIRQISLPSNSFLLSECIEPEIEEIECGDLVFYDASDGGVDDYYAIVSKIRGNTIYRGEAYFPNGNEFLGVTEGHSCYSDYKLIRKAKDITIEDRVKYLGETPMEIEVTDAGVQRGFSKFQIEQISQIIDGKLTDNLEAMVGQALNKIIDDKLKERENNAD